MRKNMIGYCGEIVKSHDVDRFLISMFAPAGARESLWALFAFNHEIAKTREMVSDMTLGHIRLQWWRDAFKGMYDEQGGYVGDHEILKPLYKAIIDYNLEREEFDNLLYAREFDLEDVLPGNLEGMMNYAEFTTAPLLRLAIKICGGDPAQEVVQPVAINYALAGILRAVVFHAKSGRFYLPEDLMDKHNISKQYFFDEKYRGDICLLIKEIIDGKMQRSSPDHVVLKASEALSDIYFKQIRSVRYDVMSARINMDPSLKVMRMFWKMKML